VIGIREYNISMHVKKYTYNIVYAFEKRELFSVRGATASSTLCHRLRQHLLLPEVDNEILPSKRMLFACKSNRQMTGSLNSYGKSLFIDLFSILC